MRVTSRYCRHCRRRTSHEKTAANLGCMDGLLILFTFGLWIPFIVVVRFFFDPWRCKVCGTRKTF